MPETVTEAEAPPPVILTGPDLGPPLCGINFTYILVALKVAPVRANAALFPNVELSADTWKSALGGVIIILSLPVSKVPVIETLWLAVEVVAWVFAKLKEPGEGDNVGLAAGDVITISSK